MVYAEIIFTGDKFKDEKEFYLKFYYKDVKGSKISDEWVLYLEEKFKQTKETVFHDIYFTKNNPAYLISREFVLNYLAQKEFIPVSENLFYKK